MHDVAVSLDRHDVAELHAAVLRDSANIVTSKIDEHDMFGAFFGIGRGSSRSNRWIFFVGRSSFTSSSKRPNRDLAICQRGP